MEIIRTYDYSCYGLNKYRNPMDEEFIETDDIAEECFDILDCMECSNCAVFVHFLNDEMVVFHQQLDDINVYSFNNHDMDNFQIFDAEMRLCSYTLIIETLDGWKIVE